MGPKKETGTSARKPAPRKSRGNFSDEERAAMKDRAAELKKERRRGTQEKDTEREVDVLAKIAEMPPADRALAERLHILIKTVAPALSPKTWYGMPAYAKDGNVVCFFQSAHRFKSRYATFGFSDKASLDDGQMWPVGFALKKLTPEVEQKITALVKKATG